MASVMTVEDNSVSFAAQMDEEYQEAKKNGFNGSKQEYLLLRDYV